MTKDDILQALRLTAMGRAGHPLQEQLAEKLSLLFEGRDWEPLCHCPSHAAPQVPDGAVPAETPAKRTRKTKAE